MKKNEAFVGGTYWQLIEPAFDSVSLHDGPDVFLEQFAKLPEPVGHLLAAHWCQSEVGNGGFHQFFAGSTGVMAPEALAGFEAMGLDIWSTQLREIMKVWGDDYPRDIAARQRALEGAEHDDLFDAADSAIFDWMNQGLAMWATAADAYAYAAKAGKLDKAGKAGEKPKAAAKRSRAL